LSVDWRIRVPLITANTSRLYRYYFAILHFPIPIVARQPFIPLLLPHLKIESKRPIDSPLPLPYLFCRPDVSP
jgi:hypothetical protein